MFSQPDNDVTYFIDIQVDKGLTHHCCGIQTWQCAIIHSELCERDFLPRANKSWGYKNNPQEQNCLLRCDALQSGRCVPTFQRDILPSFEGEGVNPASKQTNKNE
jgi:hypothetical protein